MKTKTILALLSAITVLAVFSAIAFSHRSRSVRNHATDGARTFQVHGQIRGIDAANQTIRIAHDAIPNYMPAMIMPFAVKDATLLKGLAAGDSVQFELAVTDNDSWISHLEKIAADAPLGPPASATNSTSETELTRIQVGEMVPNFQLTDQAGRPIQLRDYRGQAVVLTFLYTRCPLPNYCPLMAANFAELQKRLSKEFPDRYHLLSVSIDPQFDTPEVLKRYAAQYEADERHWSFTTGTEEQINFVTKLVALFHEPENGFISHDLRTALIGPDGRLVHVWKGNAWTPYEVQRLVSESLAGEKDYATAR